MPRRVAVAAPGGPEQLRVSQFEAAPLEPRSIRVAIEAIGVNRADVLVREGKYHKATWPAVPGFEAAGTVVETRSQKWKFGDKVLVFKSREGLYADESVVNENDVVRIPPGVSTLIAASLPINWLTAYELLKRRTQLTSGETVLITAGSSGVGQAALQLARLLVGPEGQVAAVVSSELKADYLRTTYGCEVFVGCDQALATGNRYDVVLDLVGGALFRPCLLLAKDGGRVGQAANVTLADSTINVRDFYPRNITIFGFQYGNAIAIGRNHFSKDLEVLLRYFAEGALSPTISKAFDFEDAPTAHRELQKREHYGKIVLSVERRSHELR